MDFLDKLSGSTLRSLADPPYLFPSPTFLLLSSVQIAHLISTYIYRIYYIVPKFSELEHIFFWSCKQSVKFSSWIPLNFLSFVCLRFISFLVYNVSNARGSVDAWRKICVIIPQHTLLANPSLPPPKTYSKQSHIQSNLYYKRTASYLSHIFHLYNFSIDNKFIVYREYI